MNGISFAVGSLAGEGSFRGDKGMKMEVGISEDLAEFDNGFFEVKTSLDALSKNVMGIGLE